MPGRPGMSWKRPESVLVVIAARDGRVLLLERRRPRGVWQSVTGSLEPGESAPEAAMRETCEETGLCGIVPVDCRRSNRFPIIMPWRPRYAPGIPCNRERVFAILLPHPCAVRVNPKEHLRYRWATRREAMRLVWSRTNRAAIRRGVGWHA